MGIGGGGGVRFTTTCGGSSKEREAWRRQLSAPAARAVAVGVAAAVELSMVRMDGAGGRAGQEAWGPCSW